ncbi:hypothetical protein CYMTET_25539 [Cymbomonas tetramitiformis]|uniref:Ammonium transporter AmtB-like domain-containing protein n=1 Tax=Cymbomonas tetramitiformis TaxID=36881 RepID=A0AAE0FUC2_9CHLO|nr:hypothetical protein CYMTET_25539 [Cymbomonas tetramitiformis]
MVHTYHAQANNYTDIALATLDENFRAYAQERREFGTLISTILLRFFSMCLMLMALAGYGLVEAGSVRERNTKNILAKNLITSTVGGMTWWGLGYATAYGEGAKNNEANEFLGGTNFFSNGMDDSVDAEWYARWSVNWVFSCVPIVIVSGAIAGRCKMHIYPASSVFLVGFIYPTVVHWCWSTEGWLSPFRTNDEGEIEPLLGANGFIDFSGSGIVHMTGGGVAFLGTWIVGSRNGRFLPDGTVARMEPYSLPLATAGTLLIWFSWYGFNTGMVEEFKDMDYVCKIAVSSTLAASSSGLSAMLLHAAVKREVDIISVLRGIVAGLVSISSSVIIVETHMAAAIGIAAGLVYKSTSMLLLWLRIDDVLDAVPVHYFCGLLGCLAAGLLGTKEDTTEMYGASPGDYGYFYGAPPDQLILQCIGAASITGWVMFTSFFFFKFMDIFDYFRLSAKEEREGLGRDRGLDHPRRHPSLPKLLD